MAERIEGEYMALGGDELLEVIKRKVGDALKGYNQYFGPHLAYHNPYIRLAINVECYTPEKVPTDGGFELVVKLTDGPCMEPDRLRDEVGIGVYETKMVDELHGILADVKKEDKPLKPSSKEIIAKIDKLMNGEGSLKTEDGIIVDVKKPKPRGKTKRARKRSGWPKGKKRGPRVARVPSLDVLPAAEA